MVVARPPVAAGDHQAPLDLVRLHQRRPLKVPDRLLAHLKKSIQARSKDVYKTMNITNPVLEGLFILHLMLSSSPILAGTGRSVFADPLRQDL